MSMILPVIFIVLFIDKLLLQIQIVHPFTFYLNSNLTSNRAEECNTHSTPDCHHGGHNLPSKPPPELLIPHTPSISYLTDPNSTRIIIFLALPSNLPPNRAFWLPNRVLFRRHSVGEGYSNDCVLVGVKLGGKVSYQIKSTIHIYTNMNGTLGQFSSLLKE